MDVPTYAAQTIIPMIEYPGKGSKLVASQEGVVGVGAAGLLLGILVGIAIGMMMVRRK